MTHPSSYSAQSKDSGHSLRAHPICQIWYWAWDTDPITSFEELKIGFTIETPVISDSSSVRVKSMISDSLSMIIESH